MVPARAGSNPWPNRQASRPWSPCSPRMAPGPAGCAERGRAERLGRPESPTAICARALEQASGATAWAELQATELMTADPITRDGGSAGVPPWSAWSATAANRSAWVAGFRAEGNGGGGLCFAAAMILVGQAGSAIRRAERARARPAPALARRCPNERKSPSTGKVAHRGCPALDQDAAAQASRSASSGGGGQASPARQHIGPIAGRCTWPQVGGRVGPIRLASIPRTWGIAEREK